MYRLDNPGPRGLSQAADGQAQSREPLTGGLYSNGPVRNLIYLNIKAGAQISMTANQVIISREYHSCEQVKLAGRSARSIGLKKCTGRMNPGKGRKGLGAHG